MSNYEIFDIDKAEKLRIAYKQKCNHEKEKLIRSLIALQRTSIRKSIVGEKISIHYIYKKKTIETILNDLGYQLISYKIKFHQKTSEEYTVFSFIPKACHTAEDN